MSLKNNSSRTLSEKDILQNYLVVTTVNKNYLNIFDVWYHYFKETRYLSILRVITLDKISDDHVSKKSIQTIPINKSSSDFSNIILWRFEAIFALLEEGKNIIHTDADAIWMKPMLEDIIDEKYDIQVSLGYGIPAKAKRKWGFTLCTGFMILQSKPKLNKFYQDWLEENAKLGDDQISFNNLLLSSNGITWELESTHENYGYNENYNLRIEAISFSKVTRESYYKKALVFHPYLHSDNQNKKLTDLINRLQSLDQNPYLKKYLDSILSNPIECLKSYIGWIKIVFHKGRRKLLKKIFP